MRHARQRHQASSACERRQRRDRDESCRRPLAESAGRPWIACSIDRSILVRTYVTVASVIGATHAPYGNSINGADENYNNSTRPAGVVLLTKDWSLSSYMTNCYLLNKHLTLAGDLILTLPVLHASALFTMRQPFSFFFEMYDEATLVNDLLSISVHMDISLWHLLCMGVLISCMPETWLWNLFHNMLAQSQSHVLHLVLLPAFSWHGWEDKLKRRRFGCIHILQWCKIWVFNCVLAWRTCLLFGVHHHTCK